jgi:uncharacterized membrane protein (DUF485 family)
MNTANQRRVLATSLSLIILAVGFSALGLISFINKQALQNGELFSAEGTYSIVGSSFSVLVGATFLAAAIFYSLARLRSERTVAQLETVLL